MATRTCEVREHVGKVVDRGVAVTDEKDTGTWRRIHRKAAANPDRKSKYKQDCHGRRDDSERDEKAMPFVARSD
jgi:hypothetical protein